MADRIEHVLIVGAGVMGASIAQVFAANGYKTVMAARTEESLDKAWHSIDANIAGLIDMELADASYGTTVHENLSAIKNDVIPSRAPEFDLIIESVFEDPAAKHEVFKTLAASCRDDCILASNTSGMDIFSVTADIMTHPERMLITHWFNPPHLMKLVEVVRGPETSDETIDTVRTLLEGCDKKPAVLNKFMPGFIVNRMSTVICRELFYMIDQGWASPQDLEDALRYTDGLRWSFEGPLSLLDFVGLKITTAVEGPVLQTTCNSAEPSPYAQRLLAAGKGGVRDGEGIMGAYPDDIDGMIAKRNRRIVQMRKVMDQFEQEDQA